MNFQNPKIVYYNLGVKGGIEKIGNYILQMLDGLNVIEYKLQNPPIISSTVLVEERPDVILMNEFYPRLVRAAYYYKMYHPESRIVLINHTLGSLQAWPYEHDVMYKGTDGDGMVMINYFLKDQADNIINLNWYPAEKEYEQRIKARTVDLLFPVDLEEFYISKQWRDREKEFLYFGNVLPHKFSEELVDAIPSLGITVDVYGKLYEEEHPEYSEKVKANCNYLGYAPAEKVHEIMNDYRFFLSGRGGHEPFMMTMAEVIMSGCIPLVVNDRSKGRSWWIDHYLGCYLEYQSIDELAQGLDAYKAKKDDSGFRGVLTERSNANADEMANRTNWKMFRRVLRDIIHNGETRAPSAWL